MEFSRQEYWSGVPFPTPGYLPDLGIRDRQIKMTMRYNYLLRLVKIIKVTIADNTKQLVQFSSVTQLCLTLCNPMDLSPPGSSVHGFLQARILKCVAIPFSRGSSQPRDWSQVSHIAGRFFYHLSLNIREMTSLTFMQKQQQQTLLGLWYMWMKFILLLQKMTTRCQILPSWRLRNMATVCSQVREIKIGKKWL